MKLITGDLLDHLVLKAAAHARQRMHHNVHDSLDDPIQRLFIAARLESYFRPHRHRSKWECAVVLRGRFDILVFDEGGRLAERVAIGSGAAAIGFEIPANTWHSWVPMLDGAVAFEIKEGPYNPLEAADFASWAPEEGTAGAGPFLARMRTAGVGEVLPRRGSYTSTG